MKADAHSGVSISVILACHNASETIDFVLDDLLVTSAQCPAVDMEILVVDDGSTDGTAQIVSGHRNATLLRQSTNAGVCEARRLGLNAAKGEFVWFVDADDRIPAGALLEFERGLVDPQIDVVIGKAESVDEGTAIEAYVDTGEPACVGRRLRLCSGADATAALLRSEVRGQLWDKLIRRRLLDQTAFTGSRVHSDIPITAAALAAANKVAAIDGLVYIYTIRRGSIIGSARKRSSSIIPCGASVLLRASSVGVDHKTMAYFRSWFVGLSIYRDLEASDYTDEEAREYRDLAQDSITWEAIVASLRFGALRHALSFSLAGVSGGLFLSVRRIIRVQRVAHNDNRRASIWSSVQRNGRVR